MRQWFTFRGKNTSRSSKAPRAKARLFFEKLEDRCVPSGATLTVNTTADNSIHGDNFLTLREAVDISQGGSLAGLSAAELSQISGNPAGGNDTIVFRTGLTGTISLTLGELNGAAALSQNLTIAGPGASLLAVSGVGTQILNNGTAGIGLTISGLTIENGFNGGPGGAIENNGILTLTNDVFTDNTSTIGGGGAIANTGAGATLIATGTSFTSNSATDVTAGGGGGAIFNTGAGNAMTLTNCTFTDNSESSGGAGGGGAIFSPGAGSPMTLTNDTFANNSAAGTGGAIFSPGASSLTITNGTFTHNTAQNGGAVAATGSAAQPINIINSSFNSNRAIGGAVGGGALDITNNTSSVNINNSSFSQNLTDLRGGAISSGSNTGVTAIDGDTFSGNIAQSAAVVAGGAFFDTNSTQLAITNSSFSGNVASSSTSAEGGALYLNATGGMSRQRLRTTPSRAIPPPLRVAAFLPPVPRSPPSASPASPTIPR